MNAKRLTLLDTAAIPGGGELRLFQEGAHFSIKIAGSGDLMSTRMHGSEDALAELACRRIAARPAPRVLIGGLGLGFTLAAALRHLGPHAEVVVAELVPGVVAWNRDVLGAHAGHPLRDPRAVVQAVDVAQLLRGARAAYDAVMLDVDNGPDGLTHAGNEWLYSPAGLRAIHTALRPGGVLTVWSAGPDRQFSVRLRSHGYAVEEVTVRAHGNKGARHRVWVAQKGWDAGAGIGDSRTGVGAARREAAGGAGKPRSGAAGSLRKAASGSGDRGGIAVHGKPADKSGDLHSGIAAARRKPASGANDPRRGGIVPRGKPAGEASDPRGGGIAPRRKPVGGSSPVRRAGTTQPGVLTSKPGSSRTDGTARPKRR
ncbi:hypothetical protein [Tahibacter harae]|uniref:Spermine/spermidine synthase n=1 Tax=Tahibacter harae TaxID=2963937 RepID=A0ABT1QQC0_9GAMM|nr:hypothetical protein [Tahibacter harae]